MPPRRRRSGLLNTWDDDRGYGFVQPADGGHQVFLHISGYDRSYGRPQVGSTVTFTTGPGRDGREQAVEVRPDGPVAGTGPLPGVRARPGTRARPGVRARPGRRRAWPWVVVLLWCVALGAATVVEDLPGWVPVAYAGTSLVCFVAYAQDKRAAVAGRWRTSEATLLLLGLVGGWPGAVVAQETLRHKTVKRSFQSAFWVTVVVHVVVVGAVAVDRWWYPLL